VVLLHVFVDFHQALFAEGDDDVAVLADHLVAIVRLVEVVPNLLEVVRDLLLDPRL
jgi:hypothetical protein